ncbi:MAG: VOC family protein [Dehalococcoidales bacterium]|nr:VOC family protein [Dehalococcoidales bacterium]
MEQNTSSGLSFSRPWDMAVVVHDLKKTVKRLESFGMGPFILPDAPEGAEGLFYREHPLESNYKALVGRLGNMQIEIIQPDDKPNPWSEFLRTRGEGIHHIGFQVDNVEKEVNRLQSRGAEIPFVGKQNGKIGAAYIELKVANLVLELTSFSDLP